MIGMISLPTISMGSRDGLRPQCPDGSLGPRRCEGLQVGEHLRHPFAVVADVHHVVDGLQDLVVVAAHSVTVPAEYFQLGRQLLGPGEEVAGVAVLRHQTEGLALTAAADGDPGAGAGDG